MKQTIIDAVNRTIYKNLAEDETLLKDADLQHMLFYALGFDEKGGLLSCGKRLRPLFCCLCCGILNGDHQAAVAYGAALEMLHNFTLVHDDIEDNGDIRHHRPALWKRNGLAPALNAGDMLFALALSAVQKADRISGLKGNAYFMKMLKALFLGQHRDIQFEGRTDISEAEYLQMISGKTSALIGCSFALGAMAGGASEEVIADFETAGQKIGLAFQIRDDYLGTWGDKDIFGKSVSGDIIEKKNTLAVVYTAAKDPEFRKNWAAYDGSAERVPEFSERMEKAGAPEYLAEQCLKYTREAETFLRRNRRENAYQRLLDELIISLTDRNL